MKLADRCVVVTGGAHGIGRALAERFAERGANVVVADMHPERTARIAERVHGLPVVCDVGQRSDIADLVRRAAAAYGPVYVFCSNAGMLDAGQGLDSSREQIDRIFDVNVIGHIWAAQDVIPSMVAEGEGYLLQTVSSAGLVTSTAGMGYTVTKHAAIGFAEWVALNYRHLGIGVTCVCPNVVNTGFGGRNEDDDTQPALDMNDPRFKEILEPEYVADLALEGLAEGRFLVLPHPRVGESFLRKAGDYDRWLEGTNRRIRRIRGEQV
jgi:NAD(P)-dependent dehydrogenase (short-subunit alcohol dehydrogenase family)